MIFNCFKYNLCVFFQLPDVTTEEHEDYKEESDCDSLSEDELKKGNVLAIYNFNRNLIFTVCLFIRWYQR